MKEERIAFYVPWSDLSEWNAVKKKIFSSSIENIIRAYEMILMWKLRFEKLPAYIECTRSLLQVMIKEYEASSNEEALSIFKEHDLQLSYSTALIRFVNLVSSLSSSKGESLYLAARNQNIPDWIINMRHDAAHGQDLPSLESLYEATELSLKWLLDNYWVNPENSVGENFEEVSCSPQETLMDWQTEMNGRNFFERVFDIWEFCNVGLQCVKDMPQDFFLHFDEMLSLYNFYYSNELGSELSEELQCIIKLKQNSPEIYESIKTKQFKKLLLVFVKKLTKSKKELTHCLIMSLLDTSFLSEVNLKLNKWKPIIHLIQELGLFTSLLEILFGLAAKGHKVASSWLQVFPPSLSFLDKQWAVFKMLAKENKNYKTRELKAKVKKQHKGKEFGVIFSLGIFEPPVLGIEMIRAVLLEPDALPKKTIIHYLKLIKPGLPKVTIQLVKELLSLKGIEEKEPEEVDKIYTVEDLENLKEAQEVAVVYEEENVEEKGWTKSSIGSCLDSPCLGLGEKYFHVSCVLSDNSVWSKCPLGLLPFQSKVDCSLPEDLNWKRHSSTRKRSSILLVKHAEEMKKMRQE